MLAILKQFPGAHVRIVGLFGVDESKTYTLDIVNTFRDAGWQVNLDLSQSSPNPPVGIICKPDLSRPEGLALRAAIQKLPSTTITPIKWNDSPKHFAGGIIVGLEDATLKLGHYPKFNSLAFMGLAEYLALATISFFTFVESWRNIIQVVAGAVPKAIAVNCFGFKYAL